VIDLDGLAVTPRFIDLHSHSGVVLHHDGLTEPKIRQWVALVIEQDGLECAALSPGQEDVIKSLLAAWAYPEAQATVRRKK